MSNRLIWPEEVAALLGVTPAYVKRLLTESKAAHARDRARARHIPLPVDYKRRQVSNGHHLVTVTSPRWRESNITRWAAHRPGRGNWGADGHQTPRKARAK